MDKQNRIALLEEAVALEKAGAHWTLKHVCAITGYSDRFIRGSDCPRASEEGQGPTGKGRIVYQPAEVRDWQKKRLRKAG